MTTVERKTHLIHIPERPNNYIGDLIHKSASTNSLKTTTTTCTTIESSPNQTTSPCDSPHPRLLHPSTSTTEMCGCGSPMSEHKTERKRMNIGNNDGDDEIILAHDNDNLEPMVRENLKEKDLT